MFIVRLLAPPTVADDRIAFANRASPQHDVLAVASPVGFELVRHGRKWDKENRSSWGSLPALTRQDRSRKRGPLLLNRKFPTGEE
jgi:hypothetical protein